MQEDDSDIKQVPLLKEYVRKIIVSPVDNNFLFKLNFINSVQRSGVSYHFEHEIDEALHQIYEISTKENNIVSYDDDLHHLALLFRLLRQQGYRISSGMILPCSSLIPHMCLHFSLYHCFLLSIKNKIKYLRKPKPTAVFYKCHVVKFRGKISPNQFVNFY